MKVTIKSITDSEDFEIEDVEVYIDGEKIGEGYYGGEPEDNMRSRTYKWVEPLLKTLAEKLGAEVEIQKIEVKDNE